jgi:hypothetical protein
LIISHLLFEIFLNRRNTSFNNQLLAPYLMDSMRSFLLAVFLQIQFRRTFSDTNVCTIVSFFTLTAFEPDILSFTLLFSHKLNPHQTGSLM